jgi:hypothetical protein
VLARAAAAGGTDAQLHVQEAAVPALPGGFHIIVFAIGVGVLVQETLSLGGVRVHIACQIELEDLRWRIVAQDADKGGID